MRVKAGGFTLGLTFIGCGVLLLLNIMNIGLGLGNLWVYSPLLLALLGLEVVFLSLINGYRGGGKVEVSGGSVVFLVLIIIAIYAVTKSTDLQNIVLGDFIRI